MEKKRVLIVGAGLAGKELLGELEKKRKKYYQVVGFVDDDLKKQGKRVMGVRVMGTIEELSELVGKCQVDEIFIAIPSAQGETIRRVIKECQKERIIFRVVPRTLEIVEGKVKLYQVRQIEISDLLGRAIVQSKQGAFYREFGNKRILVTGAAGSIGSELSRQLIQFKPKRLVGVDWWESGLYELELELEELGGEEKFEPVIANIREGAMVKRIFTKYKPEYVFHAAAYKHVPMMQKYPDEAVANNVFGTEVVARAAYENGVEKFVNISTDKAVNPTSVMGVTKAIAERVVAKDNERGKTKYISVRFGNVLGSQGSVVPIFKRQIAKGGPVTLTDPAMTRFFMTIPEAVQLVLQASLMGKGGETFILDMGEPVKIIELAEMMIRLSGLVPGEDIEIKIVGKRPGEKMYEELASADEEMKRSANRKIYKVSGNGQEGDGLEEILKELRKKVVKLDRRGVYRILKQMAPGLLEMKE